MAAWAGFDVVDANRDRKGAREPQPAGLTLGRRLRRGERDADSNEQIPVYAP